VRPQEQADFEAYVAARAAALRRTAYLLCGDWHQAEDVVQNALTKLYLAWRRVEKRDGIDAYARQIVVRCVLDERRRGWRRERPVLVLPDVVGVDPSSDDREILLAALAAVPPQQRAVLVLRYWDDVSIAETASMLGISEGAVKSASSRGLDNLRRALPDLSLTASEED
jgi:RNA polymerase sigma-70 factor (sigma-E family)